MGASEGYDRRLLRGVGDGADVRAKLRTVLDALESLLAASMAMDS